MQHVKLTAENLTKVRLRPTLNTDATWGKLTAESYPKVRSRPTLNTDATWGTTHTIPKDQVSSQSTESLSKTGTLLGPTNPSIKHHFKTRGRKKNKPS